MSFDEVHKNEDCIYSTCRECNSELEIYYDKLSEDKKVYFMNEDFIPLELANKIISESHQCIHCMNEDIFTIVSQKENRCELRSIY